jgi:hypothetical protein
MALIKNNAKVASQIAVELAKLRNSNGRNDEKRMNRLSTFNAAEQKSTPLVIGGSIIDVHYRVSEKKALEVSVLLNNAKRN